MRHRSCAQGSGNALRVGGQHACPVELETYLEVVRHFIVVADVQRDFAVLLVLDVALLVSIARTEIEAVLVRGTRDADVVVGDEPSLEDFILPVGVSRPVREVVFRVALVPQLFVVQQFEAFGIRQCNFVGDGLETERAVDIDACLSLFRLLGGNDNHAVGTAHTEDGERRRVFQYLHGFDVLRIQEVDVVVEQSVHHIEWLVAVDGVCSAYTDFRVGACLAGVYHLHAGNLSLQCGYGVDHRLVGDFVAFNVGDGARKVSLLGAAITDDNGFGQHLRVVFHLDVDYRLAAYLDSLLHHAYIGKIQCVLRGGLDGVPAVYVGNHAIGGSLHQYGGTNQRVTQGIGHGTGYCFLLRRCGDTCQQAHRQK